MNIKPLQHYGAEIIGHLKNVMLHTSLKLDSQYIIQQVVLKFLHLLEFSIISHMVTFGSAQDQPPQAYNA